MRGIFKLLASHKIVFVWISIFLFNVLIRSYQISATPAFVVSDEVQYISEARSLGVSGKDLSGRWSPWQLTSSNSWYAELPSTVLIPAVNLFSDHPMFSAKITHVLMGSLIPLLLGGILFSLFRNQKMALYTALLATFNPWLFQFSRLAFESFFSLFFYLLGIYAFLALEGWKKLVAIIPLTLGFYQYQGHKLLLVPYVLLLVIYTYADRITLLKQRQQSLNINERAALAILLFVVILTVTFAFRLPSQEAGKRMSHISVLNSKVFSDEVNSRRRLSISTAASSYFTNRATVLIDDITKKYLGSFDPIYLFYGGANSSDSWAVTSKGKFYVLDAVFIVLGFSLFRVKQFRKGLFLLTAMLLIAPLPALLPEGPLWTTFRAAFIIPFFLMLAGCGLWSLARFVPKKLFWIFLCLYSLTVIPFYYDYFYRYPIYSVGDTYFYNRVVASYFKRLTEGDKILVIGDETRHLFISLLFYNNWLTKETYPQLSQNLNEGKFQVNAIEARGTCFAPSLLNEFSIVLVQRTEGLCAGVDENSHQVKNRLTIASIIDSGEVFKVYGDTLCSQYPLSNYSKVTSNVFNVEQLSDEQFCRTFFVRYE